MAQRPFKVMYLDLRNHKAARISSCGSPEGVARSVAPRMLLGEFETAFVTMYTPEGECVAVFDRTLTGGFECHTIK